VSGTHLPFLSIITVTFNAERYLERTIQSVLAQHVQEFEYLVIDGGSTDGTLGIIQDHASRINHWISEPDRGLYDAMNKGLRLAKGQYVWFMNAGDEIFAPDVVAKLYEAFAQEADVCYGDALFVHEDGSALGLRSQVTPHLLPLRLRWQDFRLGMVVCHQSFVVRRRLAPEYLLQHRYSADVDWEIKCLKASKKVVRLPLPLARYLTGGYSVKNLRRSLQDRFVVLRRHFGLCPTLWAHVQIAWRGLWFAIKRKGKYW
jgi:glycosyltransferase involved in cell wall biosynthesis